MTETEVAGFLPLVARYSAPRFNAVISCLEKTLPAARSLRLRSVKVKSRAMINQL